MVAQNIKQIKKFRNKTIKTAPVTSRAEKTFTVYRVKKMVKARIKQVDKKN